MPRKQSKHDERVMQALEIYADIHGWDLLTAAMFAQIYGHSWGMSAEGWLLHQLRKMELYSARGIEA